PSPPGGRGELCPYVGNLSRNVCLESQNHNPAELSRHGHVMFMHSPRVKIYNAGFYDLGRTDKRIPVNDPKLDADRKLVAGSGANPRGRYPIHFHRTGSDVQTTAIPVKGCAVVNSPGWGYVNHSSYVEFEDNVAYNVHGAAFVTEAGDEIGSFRRNLAVRSAGSGHDTIARNDIQDFGHEGSGFWLQGGGVAVEDNIAAGHRDAAFFFFTSGLIEDGLGRMGFLASNLPASLKANNIKSPKEKLPPGRMTINFLPLRSCKGNIAFASGIGILIRFHSPPATETLVEDCTIWRTRTGIRILYSDNIHLRNLRLIGDGKDGKNSAVAISQGSEAIGGTVYDNLIVQGWTTGIAVSDIVGKSQIIDGGYYDSRVNISLLLTYIREQRVDEIKGDIKFGPSSERDISLGVGYDAFYSRDPNVLFAPHVVKIDTPKYPKKQLYFLDQAADFVPLGTFPAGKFHSAATGHVPEELIGKTNRELWEEYGLAIAGAIAPADAKTEPKIDALVGSRTTYPPPLVLHNVYSPKLEGYRPSCTQPGQAKKVVDAPPVDLKPGWNLVSAKISDHDHAFLVFGGANKPGYGDKKKPGSYGPDEKPKPMKDAKPMP
ncbi:MAG TPA: right-handed parallel beta-helix repeat-containing protein, partial [Gemmataceae bacterium]|nr:right-handed parallel beta-helix repeat-containing protein [Gemmataceae bacterium]